MLFNYRAVFYLNFKDKMKTKIVRDATDRQLATERVKTNEVIEQAHSEGIEITDKKINENRKRSNQERHNKSATASNMLVERKEEDEIRKVINEKKNMAIDSALSQERDNTDYRMKNERINNDEDASSEQTTHDAAISIRDKFLSIVSHDLKNPLSAILMSVSLMQKNIKLGRPQDQNKALDVIYRNALNMNRMITDLLDLERIAQQKLVVNLEKLDLCELINECKMLFEPIIHDKKFVLDVEKCSDTILVNADRDRIVQVISNLIGNSLKFTPSGGKIKITVKNYPERATISVIDNGPGIPSDKKDKIFERFSQLSSAPITGSGLGLGLYISKWIIESHKGKIEVFSKVGEGAEFKITIPK